MNNAFLSRWGVAAVIFGGLCVSAWPAAAKSLPKKIKSCGHQKVSVTISSNQSLAQQKAIQAWEAKTGAKYAIALDKQFTCHPSTSVPHGVDCTLTARPCHIKKIFYPTLQPEKERLGPPPGYTTRGSNTFALTPGRSGGGGGSLTFSPRGSFGGGASPGIQLRGRR